MVMFLKNIANPRSKFAVFCHSCCGRQTRLAADGLIPSFPENPHTHPFSQINPYKFPKRDQINSLNAHTSYPYSSPHPSSIHYFGQIYNALIIFFFKKWREQGKFVSFWQNSKGGDDSRVIENKKHELPIGLVSKWWSMEGYFASSENWLCPLGVDFAPVGVNSGIDFGPVGINAWTLGVNFGPLRSRF